MADRTSAELFSHIFEMLASDEPLDKAKLAKRFYNMTRGYDFNAYQMGCDDALLKLGLAKMEVNPEYPDDGEVIRYQGEDYDE